jgi:hypothetical protein
MRTSSESQRPTSLAEAVERLDRDLGPSRRSNRKQSMLSARRIRDAGRGLLRRRASFTLDSVATPLESAAMRIRGSARRGRRAPPEGTAGGPRPAPACRCPVDPQGSQSRRRSRQYPRTGHRQRVHSQRGSLPPGGTARDRRARRSAANRPEMISGEPVPRPRWVGRGSSSQRHGRSIAFEWRTRSPDMLALSPVMPPGVVTGDLHVNEKMSANQPFMPTY